MLWAKKIGPITGIWESKGISMGANAVAEFHSL